MAPTVLRWKDIFFDADH